MQEKRRNILKKVGGIGTLSMIGGVVRAQPTEKELPDTYDKHGTQGSSFEDPAFFSHIIDQSAGIGRVRQYERTGNPDALMTPHLREQLTDGEPETVDVQIQTSGQKNVIRSNGPFDRKLHGWQPKPGEVEQLSSYGSVGKTPDVASTNVGMTGVSVDDLPEIADLPFVMEIGINPSIQGRNGSNPTGSDGGPARNITTSSTRPSLPEIKGSGHSDFDSISHTLDSNLKIGFFIAGYDSSGSNTYYETNWGTQVGLDSNLAKDFTNSGGWEGESGHATDVLNTTAKVISDHSSTDDHLVPLRTYNESENVKASEFANAVDYAIKNDIAASVTTLIITNNIKTCPSTVCAELESYASAGYLMTVASGNEEDDYDDAVDDPSQSFQTLGVGGYGSSCSGGYEHYLDTSSDLPSGSQYGEIEYHNSGLTYCSYCYDGGRTSKFTPDIYSCYEFYPTDSKDNYKLKGTSFAAPIVAAGAAIDASANPGISHGQRVEKYHNMNNYNVCTSTQAPLGQVLHAPDLV